MKFPVMTDKERIERLTPKGGRVKMVLDTDTYNEVDDQFALSYALMSPDRLEVQAVYAAPFSGTFFAKYLAQNGENVTAPPEDDLEEGMELSYQEILKIFRLLDMDPEGKAFRGSKAYMTQKGVPVDSEAARDLVKKANAADDVLYVVAIGEITNVASAILMDPKIIKKIVVVWLGGHPTYWPNCMEFNMAQDVIASQTILDCGVPLVIVPCMTVASHLTTTEAELTAYLKGKSRIGTYLSDLVISQLSQEAAENMFSLFRQTSLEGFDDYDASVASGSSSGSMAPSRIIWDISTIGYMINPLWCPSTLVPAPVLTNDITWAKGENRHLIRICHFVYRDGIFGDMFVKLSKAPK